MDRKYFLIALLLIFISAGLAFLQLFPPQREETAKTGRWNILLALDQLEEYAFAGNREAFDMMLNHFNTYGNCEEAEIWKKWITEK